MPARAAGVVAAVLLLAGAAGAALWAEAARPAGGRAAEFQRLVGGLGFGPALDLGGCAFGLDPRLDGACECRRGPVPGGACFCPRHAGNLMSYPPLPGGPDPEPGDAPPP